VGAPRPLAGGWAWLCALGTHWVTYWPELTSLVIGAHTVREATGRVLRGVRRCSGATAGGVRRGVRVARRAAVAGRRVIGGCWVRVVCPAAIMTGRLASRVGVGGWRRVEPSLRDAAGWLVHTAPGVVGRLLLRFAGWLPVALARVVRHAVVGLGWLLARWGRYCLAYPEYAGIVREAHELDRPRRARVALVAWRRAATRRSLGAAVLLLAGWLGLWWLDDTHGTLAVAAVGAVLVAALALVGRAVRPLPEREPGQEPGAEPGPDDPYPIADAHTRTDAADCVRRALTAEALARYALPGRPGALLGLGSGRSPAFRDPSWDRHQNREPRNPPRPPGRGPAGHPRSHPAGPRRAPVGRAGPLRRNRPTPGARAGEHHRARHRRSTD
jgi:hypothetical protein